MASASSRRAASWQGVFCRRWWRMRNKASLGSAWGAPQGDVKMSSISDVLGPEAFETQALRVEHNVALLQVAYTPKPGRSFVVRFSGHRHNDATEVAMLLLGNIGLLIIILIFLLCISSK